MCGIAGWMDRSVDMAQKLGILQNMGKTLKKGVRMIKGFIYVLLVVWFINV